jgi:hypothetical protein
VAFLSVIIPYGNCSAINVENTISVSGQESINPSSLPTVPLNRVGVRTAVQGKKGLTTVLTSLSVIIPYVNCSAINVENSLSVSGQASIHPSSLPTVPLNRVRVRTAVQGKKWLTTVLPSSNSICELLCHDF